MKILVVVDMQKDFIDGSLGTPEAVAIVPSVIEKIKELNLYMSFVYAAGDVYVQIFEEWADKYGLDFSVREEKK